MHGLPTKLSSEFHKLVTLPCRPTDEVLELLSKEASELKPRSHATPTTSKPGKESDHTLEQFAKENFRKAQQVGAGGTTRQKTLIHSAGEICKYIKE